MKEENSRGATNSMSISIACFNEEATIERLVNECFEFLKSVTGDYEVFVVDDGSSDRSPEILESLKNTYPNLRVHYHEKNRGFGPTLTRIYGNTSKDINGFLPGDAQIDTSAIEIMLKHLDEVDLVLGFRENRHDSFRRRISSKGYNFLIRLLSGKPIRDVNTACVYRSKIMEGVELRSTGAFIHAEFFLRLMKKGCAFKAAPIPHLKREGGSASGGRPDVIIKAAGELFLYLIGARR